VRAAIFNMILSQAGSPGGMLPPSSRWLDLCAGTGSVGLEAASRGAAQVHFVELDPWVCRNILGPNIRGCGFSQRAVVHTSKVEAFLQRGRDLPRFAGGAFDFISLCPPYLLVSYPELFGLLEGSALLHGRTILLVEYPRQLAHQVPATLGPLAKVRDRKYGRTWIAVYGSRPSQGPVRQQSPEGPGGSGRSREGDGWGDALMRGMDEELGLR
jgi:16S rRNA (guanine(966)-N(2))-methyltransferase RsmD